MNNNELALLLFGAVIDNVIVDARSHELAALVLTVPLKTTAQDVIALKGPD